MKDKSGRPKQAPKASNSEINNLVESYRAGDTKAAEKLIQAFEPLLRKYDSVLWNGTYYKNDGDLDFFIRMLSRKNMGNTGAAASLISQSIRNMYEHEDLKQELILALLMTARQYNCIAANYKYAVKDAVMRLLKESPIFDRMDDGIEYCEDSNENVIDESWVLGITAGSVFAALTEEERRIVKLLFYNDIKMNDAAKILNMSIRALRIKKSEIINKLREEYDGR